MSDNNTNCDGCNGCDGCYGCNGCNGCDSCKGCEGCYGCDGCYGCNGCDSCYGCFYSFGLKDCKATYESIFSTNQFGAKFMLFNKQVDEGRINEIMEKLLSFGWYPKQTNAFELYLKNGSDWSKIPTSQLGFKGWYGSWLDMPKEAITYLQSLPEFDATLFKEISGLDAENSKKKELLDKANELITKANELKEQAEKL